MADRVLTPRLVKVVFTRHQSSPAPAFRIDLLRPIRAYFSASHGVFFVAPKRGCELPDAIDRLQIVGPGLAPIATPPVYYSPWCGGSVRFQRRKALEKLQTEASRPYMLVVAAARRVMDLIAPPVRGRKALPTLPPEGCRIAVLSLVPPCGPVIY